MGVLQFYYGFRIQHKGILGIPQHFHIYYCIQEQPSSQNILAVTRRMTCNDDAKIPVIYILHSNMRPETVHPVVLDTYLMSIRR